MAGLFDNIFGGGGNMFGGNSLYADMLTPEQMAAVRNQSMMQVAAKLLESSGPSTTRRTLGQTLGGALSAGAEAMQTGQANAVQQMLLKQKLDEAKLTAKQRDDFNAMLTGAAAPRTPLTAQQALLTAPTAAGRAGPTPERAAMIGTTPQAAPTASGAPQTMQEFLQTQPPAYLQSLQGMPMADAMKSVQERMNQSMKYGKPEFYLQDGKLVAKQFNELGQEKIVPGLAPRDTPPSAIAEYEYAVNQGFQGSFQQFNERQRKSSAMQVDLGGGQRGFDNERNLRKDFTAEPIVKAYEDMRSSYAQVQSALKQGTPIGDVAAATKIMKLLDPGSVVRETELGMAMEAAGKLNRLQEYFSLWSSGRKLGTQQLADFDNLSRELMTAATQAYNQKRTEYEDNAIQYGLNPSRVVGKPASLPGPQKPAPAAQIPGLGTGTVDLSKYFPKRP